MLLLKDRKVLIVEDNTLNRVVYQVVLVTHGATMEFDRWGRDAVTRLSRMDRCDLIVMDLMLDRFKSGYDVYDEIRALARYAHIPIVAVSAADPSEAITKTKTLGFSGFISKPIDEALFPHQLLSVMNGEAIWHDGNVRA
jgi:CheY-like chemotaxis protein